MSFENRRRAVVLVAVLATLASGAFAAAGETVQRGADVIGLVRQDVSPQLRNMPPAPRRAGVKLVRRNERFIEAAGEAPDGALQAFALPSADAPTPSGQFEAVGEGIGYGVQYVPPDTNGDVGPNHYVQSVNVDYAVFSKNGNVVLGPVPTNTVWQGFGGACEGNNDGDPVVLYDQFADRWFISQFVATQPYKECIAISTSGDPTGSYYRYEYDFGRDFPDYPKAGIWPTEDAIFVTYNMFGRVTFRGPRVCAYQRSALYSGQANNGQCFSPANSYHSLLPADLDGPTLPAAETDGYFVARSGSSLVSWRADIDWANAANSTLAGPASVSGVASYTTACNGGGACIPQPGTSNVLDTLGDRLMHRAAYRVLADHQALVVNHSVAAAGTTGVRWYELRPAGSGLSVFQQGTYSPDSTHRWMGSLAMDADGNIAVGYSASSGSSYPGIRQTGRLAGDPAGTLQAEATILTGTGAQTSYARWGDYSSISVDPVDDCTFWFTTEYLTDTGVFNWHTRVASFKFPSCSGGGGGCTPTEPIEVSCTDGLDNDCDGLIDAADPDCQPTGGYTLSASGYKVRGVQHADLSWDGATGASVDVYRDGAPIATTPNDGAYTDNIGVKGGGSYVYQVCDAGTSTCSNEATVTF